MKNLFAVSLLFVGWNASAGTALRSLESYAGPEAVVKASAVQPPVAVVAAGPRPAPVVLASETKQIPAAGLAWKCVPGLGFTGAGSTIVLSLPHIRTYFPGAQLHEVFFTYGDGIGDYCGQIVPRLQAALPQTPILVVTRSITQSCWPHATVVDENLRTVVGGLVFQAQRVRAADWNRRCP